jgi:hypothetical protein
VEEEDDEEEETEESAAMSAARFCDDMEVVGPTTGRCPSTRKRDTKMEAWTAMSPDLPHTCRTEKQHTDDDSIRLVL